MKVILKIMRPPVINTGTNIWALEETDPIAVKANENKALESLSF